VPYAGSYLDNVWHAKVYASYTREERLATKTKQFLQLSRYGRLSSEYVNQLYPLELQRVFSALNNMIESENMIEKANETY
jgi:hypothetical protein